MVNAASLDTVRRVHYMLSGEEGDKHMLRIGIIGTGGMATQRAQSLAALEGAHVGAVCSRSLERTAALCALTDARGYDDYDAALAQTDAVVLCLPNHLHAPYALKALAAGRHVLVEYPLCLTRDDASALRRAAEDSGRVLMVGNTIIREAMFAYLMKHHERLGPLVSAASRVAFYGEEIAGSWYLHPEQSGSPFVSYHYHHIEYYRRFLGAVQWVKANDESVTDPDRPGYLLLSGGTLAMGHEGGATSCTQWYLSAAGAGLPRGMWLNGRAGSVTVVSQGHDRSAFMWDDGSEGKTEVCDDEWGVPGSSRDFLDAVRGELDHRARLQSDLATLEVGFAAAESARANRLIEMG